MRFVFPIVWVACWLAAIPFDVVPDRVPLWAKVVSVLMGIWWIAIYARSSNKAPPVP